MRPLQSIAGAALDASAGTAFMPPWCQAMRSVSCQGRINAPPTEHCRGSIRCIRRDGIHAALVSGDARRLMPGAHKCAPCNALSGAAFMPPWYQAMHGVSCQGRINAPPTEHCRGSIRCIRRGGIHAALVSGDARRLIPGARECAPYKTLQVDTSVQPRACHSAGSCAISSNRVTSG